MTHKLESVCDFINGGAWGEDEYSSTGIPVLRVSNLQKDGIDFSSIDFIPAESFHKYSKHILFENDLVIATVGSHPGLINSAAGRAIIIPKSAEGYLLNQNAVCIRTSNPELLDQRYLAYTGKTHPFQHYIQQRGKGAANQMRIAIEAIKEYEIKIPPLPIQRRISEVLGRYDALIENYQRQIGILEASAQTLYREWFVRGRYLYRQLESAKTRLKTFVAMNFGQSPSSEFYNETGEGLPFHQGVGTYGNRFPNHEIFCSVEGKMAEGGDILFSVRAPVGRLNIADRRLIIGRGLAALRHKKGFNSFLFYLLQNTFSDEDIIGNGAIFAAVSKAEFEEFEVMYPDEIAVEQFDKIVKPIDEKILVLEKQITALQQMRDKLLPRLMSGQIPLTAAE